MRRIVGITGHKGSGKSEAAEHLVRAHGFVRVPFAKPIKDMLRCLGLEEVHLNGSLKEKPCALLHGMTPRWAMQCLGTDWGRDLIHPDLWVTVWDAVVDRLPLKQDIVADDMRFLNENNIIRRRGGYTIRIEREGYGATEHASESGVAALPVHATIWNNGTLDDLHRIVDETLAHEV